MSMAASDVSAVAGVRRVLVRLQLEMGHRHGGVLEGRDIGTKVFSGTPHKFFLTARPEIRARRRTNEMLAKGQPADYETVLAHSQDATRQDSPLIYDKSYTVIDTIDPSIEDVVKRVVAAVGS
jgi:cytidylate kinase